MILKALAISSYLLKYADDASLLSTQVSSTPDELEMAYVMHWARQNKMSINLLKSLELFVCRPNVSRARPHSQTLIVCDAKLLGV